MLAFHVAVLLCRPFFAGALAPSPVNEAVVFEAHTDHTTPDTEQTNVEEEEEEDVSNLNVHPETSTSPKDNIKVQPAYGYGIRPDGSAHAKKEAAAVHEDHGHEEHEEGHEGHGGGHGGEHTIYHEREALGYSCSLLGAVAFNMSLFYLVNHSDDNIKMAAWQVLSMTVSIFCSVLIYNSIRAVSVGAMGFGPGVQIVEALLLYPVLNLFSQAFLYIFRTDALEHLLHPAGTICAHVVGFAAMYGFADLQNYESFHNSLGASWGVVILAIIILVAVTTLSTNIHKSIVEHINITGSEGDSKEIKQNIRWQEEVEVIENDIISLSIGFILMQAVRFTISGRPHSTEAHTIPHGVTQFQTNLLMGAAILFLCIANLGTYILIKNMHRFIPDHVSVEDLEDYAEHHRLPLAIRFAMSFHNVAAVTMAWCFLFWFEWQVYVWGWQGTRISGCMIVALGLTLLACLLVFVLDFVADRMGKNEASYIRSLILALGIVVGFSWERAFDVGLHNIAHSISHVDVYEGAMVHIFALCLCVIVLPAWCMYIVPKTHHAHSEEGSTEAGQAKKMPI